MSYRYDTGFIKPGFTTLSQTPSYNYSLYSWGYNLYGISGQNDPNGSSLYAYPSIIGSQSNWASISITSVNQASLGGALATKVDGTLWAWGFNSYGQLGLGTTSYYSSPKQVGALTNWKIISSGSGIGIAVKTDGTLWSWGNNAFGQLGLGNRTYYSSPKQVGALTNWASVSASVHVLAVKTDGTLWAWGKNQYGQLGFGNLTYYSSPKQVGALTNWASVCATGGYSYQVLYGCSFAIKTDGTLWTWGATGNFNQTSNYSSPKQVGSSTNWKSVVSSAFVALAIKTDGTLWAWGSASNGELGQGVTSVTSSSPIQVGALTNWLMAAAGSYCSFAIKTDGTLWSWGKNQNFQLGNQGQTASGNLIINSPRQVGSSTTWVSISAGGPRNNAVLALGY